MVGFVGVSVIPWALVISSWSVYKDNKQNKKIRPQSKQNDKKNKESPVFA